MSTMSATYSPSTSQPQALRPVFEFTKRKKWADLLISELSGTLILVLSPAGKVLYCGSAVEDLLGWKEDEIVDVDLATYLHDDDVSPFIAHFNASMATRSELSTFARLKSKKSEVQWPLFELRGHPHYEKGQPGECKCFFAMARPYPSRNTAMLDSFLELKMENERLRQRLMELRSSNPSSYRDLAPMSSVRTDADAIFQPPSIHALPLPHSGGGAYFPMSSSRTSLVHEAMGPIGRMMEMRERSGGEEEEGSKRKKVKKTHAGQQQYVCVTCGRTDSPEWRKGPLGAKTLCNACGLRWAKRNSKRNKSDGEPNGANSGAAQEGEAEGGSVGGGSIGMGPNEDGA